MTTYQHRDAEIRAWTRNNKRVRDAYHRQTKCRCGAFIKLRAGVPYVLSCRACLVVARRIKDREMYAKRKAAR